AGARDQGARGAGAGRGRRSRRTPAGRGGVMFPFAQARNYTRGRARPVRLIVVHDMEAPTGATTAENVARYFAGAGAPRASAHFSIDSDSVVQCVRAR